MRGQAYYQLPKILAGDRVNSSCWFIEQEHARARHKRGSKPQFLFHAARKLARAAVGEFFETDELKDFRTTRKPLVRFQSAHFGEETNVFKYSQIFVKGKSLREITKLGTRVFDLSIDIVTANIDLAGFGLQGANQQSHGRGLPRTVRTDESVDFAGFDMQGNTIHCAGIAEMFMKVGCLNQIFGHANSH